MNFTELRKLIREGDLAGVESAISENPDLLHTNDPRGDMWEERTALHCACRYAHLDIVKYLAGLLPADCGNYVVGHALARKIR